MFRLPHQWFYPHVLRQFVAVTVFGLICCGCLASITIIVVKLARGASLRLIAACILLSPAFLIISATASVLLLMPNYVGGLPWWRTVMNAGRWPKKTALLLWLRIKHGKTHPQLYSPLNSVNGQIRLLVLNAGQASEEITCSLLPVYLQHHCPSYEALSYTWGRNYCSRHILLNGSHFAVTQNLYRALKRLRTDDAPRLLWIDALSIDQSSIPERNEQVRLMKSIYSCASKVIVWLGDNTVSSCHAMNLLCSGSKQADPHTWYFDRLKTAFSSDIDQWKALLRLFKGDYWSRVWIVQETAVANTLELTNGSLSCSWDVAVAAHRAWLDFKAGSLSMQQEEAIGSIEDFSTGEVTTIPLALVPRDIGPASLSINRENVRLAKTCSLIGLLQENWTAEATDPRDKIFALLALATDCQTPALNSDYSLSKWEAYLRTMKFLLETHGSLDIITYSGIHLWPIHPSLFGVPSWTPTFYWEWEAPSTAAYSQYLYKAQSGGFRASSDRKAVAVFLPQRRRFDKILGINRAILRAQGCRIDRVASVLYNRSNLRDRKAPSSRLQQLYHELHVTGALLPTLSSGLGGMNLELFLHLRVLYHYFVLDDERDDHELSAEGKLRRERKTEILWRTLCWNRTIDGKVAPESWSSVFAVILEGSSRVPAEFDARQDGLSADDRAIAYIQPFLKAVHQISDGRRWLFETEGGRLGIANYGSVLYGTALEVCVILGCNMPMLMKERKLRKNGEFVQAQLYGAVYMHEYMQGKAIEDLDSDQLTLETFEFS